MNLYRYLRVGPRGRIYIPAEFHEHIGLPDGPAFIEAKLCVDNFIELGPVIPGVNRPRVSEVLPGLVVDDPVDEPVPAEEQAEWESYRDLERRRTRDPWRDVPQRQREDPEAFVRPSGMPSGWRIVGRAGRIHFEVPATAADGAFELTETEALTAGIALIQAFERSRLFRIVAEDEEDEEASQLISGLEVMRILIEQSQSRAPSARAGEQDTSAPDDGNEAVPDDMVGDADDDQ